MASNKRLIASGAPAGGVVNTENFDIVNYTGSNQESSRSISSLSFQPDFVWSKARNDSWPHFVYDSVRGAGTEKELQFNDVAAEGGYNNQAYGYLSSFDSNGFTSGVGPQSPYDNQYFNKSGINFATYCFKAGGSYSTGSGVNLSNINISANTAAGFSIVTYSGSASDGSYQHGLNSAPEIVIIKSINQSTRNWITHFSALGGSNYFLLNEINAQASSSARIASTDSTSVNIGTSANVSGSGNTFVAYNFHSVEGFQDIGTYQGNGASSQNITTNFQPRFVVLRATAGGHWFLYDSGRPTGEGISEAFLVNNPTAALTNRDGVDFTSTGFTVYDGDNLNTSSASFIYWAIA